MEQLYQSDPWPGETLVFFGGDHDHGVPPPAGDPLRPSGQSLASDPLN